MGKTILIIFIVLVVIGAILYFVFRKPATEVVVADEPVPDAPRIRPLVIISAEYGCDVPSCVKMNVTSAVKDKVWDDMLIIPAEADGQHFNRLFGRDPSPNLPKTLEILYSVGVNGERKNVVIPDSKGVRINAI